LYRGGKKLPGAAASRVDLVRSGFLNRQLVLPVSTISQWLRQSVEHGGRHFGRPPKHLAAKSAKARLVVISSEGCFP